ncbi:hypothetical protein [Sphingomonas sp. ID0503]|jgi:hypothetical protein
MSDPKRPGGHKPEPSFGPDEEGEVPHDPPEKGDGKPGAWVEKDDEERR